MNRKGVIGLVVASFLILNTIPAYQWQALAASKKVQTVKKVKAAKRVTVKAKQVKKPVNLKVKAKPTKKTNVKPAASKKDPIAEILKDAKKYIDENNVMKIIEDLSSPKFDGRAAGTEGNNLAGQYIADYFKKIGLESPEGLEGYKQFYKQNVGILNSKPILEVIDSSGKVQAYKYRIDFTPIIYNIYKLKLDVTSELYVLKSKDDLDNNIDKIKDKIILLSKDVRKQIPDISTRIKNSRLNIITESDNSSNGGYYLRTSYPAYMNYEGQNSGAYFQASLSAFKQLTAAASSGYKCHIANDMTVKNVELPNIIGMIKGSSPTLKKEYIILSAHFDHVGDNFDGTYNSGALDNASGVATILEIARVMKAKHLTPAKTIVFAAFNGEETGLMGSKDFVENPIIDLNHAVDINFDMIGFKGKAPYELYDGHDKATYNPLLNDIGSLFNNDKIDYNTGGATDSDHASFAEDGIPAVFIIDDIRTTIHSPNDIPSTIDKYEIENIIKIALNYVFSAPAQKPFAYADRVNLKNYKDMIDKDNITKITKDLCSEEFEGRREGTDGNEKAAQYIADYFKKLGLKEPDKTEGYKQYYDYSSLITNSLPTFDILDKEKNIVKRFSFEKDFGIDFQYFNKPKDDILCSMVLIKDKNEIVDQETKYKDKIVILSKDISNSIAYSVKTKLLLAGCNIICEDNYNFLKESFYYGDKNAPKDSGLILYVNDYVITELSKAVSSGYLCHVTCDYTIKDGKSANVIGIIPGSDESLKNEYTILYAGFDGNGCRADGTYDPSAVDNASSTALIMEIARVITENNLKPKKSIVIAALNGIQSDYLGPYYFLNKPVIDLSKASDIGFYMLGYKNEDPENTYLMAEEGSAFYEDFRRILSSGRLRYFVNPNNFGTYSLFTKLSIPSVYITNYTVTYYRTMKDLREIVDSPDIIDPDKLESIANLVLNYIVGTAKK